MATHGSGIELGTEGVGGSHHGASKFSEVDERNTSCLSKTEDCLLKKTCLTLLEDMV